jgi:hypothetical protein
MKFSGIDLHSNNSVVVSDEDSAPNWHQIFRLSHGQNRALFQALQVA